MIIRFPLAFRPVIVRMGSILTLVLTLTAAKAAEHPGEVAGLLHLGATLTERGDYSTAEIAYWQILHRPALDANDQTSALLGLAHMYRKSGELTKAVAIYQRFLKDNPNSDRDPDALLELGRTEREMGAYRLAFNSFYNVINSTLKFPPQGFDHYQQLAKTAQFEIAQTHFDAGEYADAGKFFLKVRLLDLAPSDRARAHFMAAFAQQLAGDYDDAVETLKSFLKDWPDDPNNAEARYLLATSLRQLKRKDEAMTVTLDLLRDEKARGKTDPKQWLYWQRRTGNQVANEFFEDGDIFNALSIYRGLSQLSSDPSWKLPITYQIGLCCERLGQLPEARTAYQTVAAGADPEMAKMATWRLAHMNWVDHTSRSLNAFFGPATHDPAPSAAAASTDLRPASPARAGGEPVPAAASADTGHPPA